MLGDGVIENLSSSQRLEHFNAQVSSIFSPMRCEVPRDYQGSFNCRLKTNRFQHLGMAAIQSTPLNVYRNRSHIGQAGDAIYMVKVQVEGESLIKHMGREAHLRPGDFTLCSSIEPYRLHFENAYSQIILVVPLPILQECIHQPEQHLGVRMAANVGANGLFSQFVTSIGERLEGINGRLGQRLEANIIDLLATALGYAQDEQKHDLMGQGVQLEYLRRIRHFIRKHLEDERLGPEWIASSYHISTRYLHMLFASEDISISRYIQRLRLEACGAALADRAFRNYSVTEIAYRFGFNDASHFSRVFKAHFDSSPGRYRNKKLDAEIKR